jgi:hypothetical protein
VPDRRRSGTSGGCRPACARRRSRASALHQRVEPPHVVDPEDVIGVAVREEDRVDAADAVAQRLQPQVGPASTSTRAPASPRRSTGGARVARIGRPADAQSQPIMGTPCDVPVPRNVTLIHAGACAALANARSHQGSMMRLCPPCTCT